MANFPVLFRNAAGKVENLRPADGGLAIDVLDCVTANAVVSLFDTVDNTGALTLFTAYDAAAAVGALGSTFAFAGSLTIATDLAVTGASVFNGHVDLGNGAVDNISVLGSVDSNVTFESAAPRTITIDSQNLTISTTTAGQITIDAFTEVEINSAAIDVNATGAIQMDAATASQFVVSGAADLTLGAQGATIVLNEVGDTVLDTNFTAVSLIGAVNEVKTSNLGLTTPSVLAAVAIVAGDIIYIDTDGGVAKAFLADATIGGVAQDPCGVALTGGGIGATIYIAGPGQEAIINTVIGVGEEGNPVYLYGANAGGIAGQVTLVPPVVGVGGWLAGDSSQIIGVVSLIGGAGVAKILVQMRESIDL